MKRIFLYSVVAVSLILIVIVLFAFVFFKKSDLNNSSNNEIKKDTVKNKELLPKHDTLIFVNGRKIIIKVALGEDNKGTILVLHGWNLSPEEWCTKTSLCEKAAKQGYFLVLPDMGKSNYQLCSYEETRPDWRKEPGRTFLNDTVIPYLQKNFSLLLPGERNFIMGLSTGGRGVALVALDMPKLFTAAAALSGDYDQSKLTTDKIYNAFYGPYNKYKKRWDTADNAIYRIKKFCTPIYLGHGTLDKTCPPEQTKLFYDSLKKYHPQLRVGLHMPEAGHDYQYWDSEVDNILEFFEATK